MSQAESSYGASSFAGKACKPKPLRSKTEEVGDLEWYQTNMAANLTCVFLVFCILYAIYIGFFIGLLSLLAEYGNQLLWFYFGLFLTSFGGMASFAMYSMSAQEIGWWEVKEESMPEDDSNLFCGYALY